MSNVIKWVDVPCIADQIEARKVDILSIGKSYLYKALLLFKCPICGDRHVSEITREIK